MLHIMWNPKLRYLVLKNPRLVPVLSQMNLVHDLPSYLISFLILSSHICLALPSDILPLGSHSKTCMHFSSPSYVLHAPTVVCCWGVQIIELVFIKFCRASSYLFVLHWSHFFFGGWCVDCWQRLKGPFIIFDGGVGEVKIMGHVCYWGKTWQLNLTSGLRGLHWKGKKKKWRRNSQEWRKPLWKWFEDKRMLEEREAKVYCLLKPEQRRRGSVIGRTCVVCNLYIGCLCRKWRDRETSQSWWKTMT